jgi:uncharacterized SAM-binding protein YcdF (DUF218 family)
LGKLLTMSDLENFIILVDNDSLTISDVIVLLEGDGLNRYQKAVDLYNKGFAKKIIFSGGITDYQYGSYPFEKILPHILKEGIPADVILHENKSLNTHEQAVEVIKLAKDNHWSKIILVATHEHQYRAYLTFLKEVISLKTRIILYNAPVRNLPWFSETGWGIRFNRLEKEFERIEKYSALGHLATFKDAIEYQKWKEQQA